MDTGIGSFTPASPPIRVAAASAASGPSPERGGGGDPSPAPSPAPEPERRVEIDAATNSLIFRTIDVATGVTVRQTPDETRLKLRAYIDTLGAVKPFAPTLVATA